MQHCRPGERDCPRRAGAREAWTAVPEAGGRGPGAAAEGLRAEAIGRAGGQWASRSKAGYLQLDRRLLGLEEVEEKAGGPPHRRS